MPISVDTTPTLKGNPHDQPFPSFTYTSGYKVLKVVRVDEKIVGDNIESECQAINENFPYHELSMDDQLQYDVIKLLPFTGKKFPY